MLLAFVFVSGTLRPGIFGTSVSGPSESKIILGVLEDTQLSTGAADYRSVRVIFQKQGKDNDWLPFRSECPDQGCLKGLASEYPGEMVWTIAFDGKNLGQVTTRPREFERYASVGQHQITGDGPVPTVGKKSTEFAGWQDAAVYRPLVAVSQPNFNDPDAWKPAEVGTELIKLLRRAFRETFPRVANCSRQDHQVARPWSYDDKDIAMVKAYASSSSPKNGWWLVQMRLDKYLCEGPADDGFLDQWFLVDAQKSVRFLGSGMLLVDTGDYDNDGRSEVLFAIDQYNRGGYVLFFDDFKKQATYEFSYH